MRSSLICTKLKEKKSREFDICTGIEELKDTIKKHTDKYRNGPKTKKQS